ncbi:hypothetical protein NHX12_023145 [Muraenolepis orangiensis]|uniref:Chromosomal protein D1-like n=1 Tax=Muraenolepis orangiensis TaxID=630683 RepID=A0A9Q0EN51_9TELE|nr:hypothetical protein NHX12_023145 [Muraenolepis orangiensis]
MEVEGQGDSGSSEWESGVDMPTRPTKRPQGRPKGSKKVQMLVTQVDPSEFGSGISNGGPTQPLRSRGRPKGSVKKQKDEQDSLKAPRGRGRPKSSGWKKLAGTEESPRAGQSTRKRGRPKGSTNKKIPRKFADRVDDLDFTISGSIQPKKGRGRPKGTVSLKHKAERSQSEEDEAGDSSPPRKRGRPNGSPNKKPWLAERRVSSGAESGSDSSSDGQSPAQRGRGMPRKSPVKGRVVAEQTAESESSSNDGYKSSPRGKDVRQRSGPEQRGSDCSQPAKRGPGRPKGSPNKTYPLVHRPDEMERSRKPSLPFIHPEQLGPKPKGRGRPKKELHKRGRPRKNPLSPAGDLIRPRVWKPLGRPRKYPRLDPSESLAPVPRRGRGRPRKSEIKRRYHFQKLATKPSVPNDGSPRPRGRPKGTVKDSAPEKRGRPKGSLNKSRGGRGSGSEDAGETDNDIGPCEECEQRNSAEEM